MTQIFIMKAAQRDEICISLSATKTLKDGKSYLSYGWKRYLLEEEGETYLPEGFDPNKVLELKEVVVEPSKVGTGLGRKLFAEFMQTPEAKKAQLIFLDINPLLSDKGNSEKALYDIYTNWGFRSRHPGSRMWIVRHGSIPNSKLPT